MNVREMAVPLSNKVALSSSSSTPMQIRTWLHSFKRLSHVVVASGGFKKPEIMEWREEVPVNHANLIGTIGRRIDLTYLDSGKAVANSSIRVKRPIRDDSWFFLEFWDDLAEVAAAHLKIDDQVFVSGPLWTETVRGNDGLEKMIVKVIVQDLKMVLESSKSERVEPFENRQVGNMSYKELWKDVLNNPDDWWDNRSDKKSPNHPDFKHKISQKVLWVDNMFTPSWVRVQLSERSHQHGGANCGSCSDLMWFQTCSHKSCVLQGNASGDPQTIDEKWKDFFADPSKWWDNRGDKLNPKSPDLKNKSTGAALWIESKNTPSWVTSWLVALDAEQKKEK